MHRSLQRDPAKAGAPQYAHFLLYMLMGPEGHGSAIDLLTDESSHRPYDSEIFKLSAACPLVRLGIRCYHCATTIP